MSLCFPKFTTFIVMSGKVPCAIILCYLNIRRFNSDEICDKSMEVQIKHLEIINNIS
jgi:hypothetical protein